MPNPTGCVFACPEFREAALDAARQSIVLLENDGVLPLDVAAMTNTTTIAVIGQACHSTGLMSGGWTVHWQGTSNQSAFPYGTTIFQELAMRTPGAVSYSEGCNVTEGSVCGAEHLNKAVSAATASDLVVVCVGERHYAEKRGDRNGE